MSYKPKPYLEARIEPDGTLSVTELPWNARFKRDEPLVEYGCAQLGPRRFGWLVTNIHNSFTNKAPDAFGYATSLEEAERQVTEARKPFAGLVASRNVGWVRHWHRELVRRGRKPNHAAADSKPVEYVWKYNYPFEDWEGHWEQLPIVKKTARRIFVKKPHDQEACDVIDRQQFEQTGKASTGRRGSRQTYYREPQEWSEQYSVPDCLRVFGLTRKSTIEELQAAFRREVKAAHPDLGGTSESFRAVRQAFEQAQRILGPQRT